jgi:tyrosyl-tRNA synthetase
MIITLVFLMNHRKFMATNVSNKKLVEIKSQLADGKNNPRDIKRELARILVEMYHNKEAGLIAEKEFDNIFINKGIPDELEEFRIGNNKEINILDLIILVDFAPSKGEARRLVTQGGVSIDGEKISDVQYNVSVIQGMILKVGKRKFIKLI